MARKLIVVGAIGAALWVIVIGIVPIVQFESLRRVDHVTLLVHGMSWDLDRPSHVWGQLTKSPKGHATWSGMIGFLQKAGYRFGGERWKGEVAA